MEALAIINTALFAVLLYVAKDYHGQFKNLSKKVGKMDGKIRDISLKLDSHFKDDSPTQNEQ